MSDLHDYPILIVDDNKELREVLSQELDADGYFVLTAEDGKQGLSLLKEHRVALVFLDISLPDLDGFEVLKIIKKDFPATKVVMITAHSDVYHAMESRKLGADDFVGKPYDYIEITTAIDRLRAS